MACNSGKRRIEFVLASPGAAKVSLVGSFNDWSIERHPMKPDGDGYWKKTVMLAPGSHEYKFWVDGRWEEDPHNQRRCPNGLGGCNNVVRVADKTI